MKKLLLILIMFMLLPLSLSVKAYDVYQYDITTTEGYAYNLETGKLYEAEGYTITNRVIYVEGSVNGEILLNSQTFHYMLFWDKNNNFIGYRTTTYTNFTNDYYIGSTATAVVPPTGTKTFAFMAFDLETYLNSKYFINYDFLDIEIGSTGKTYLEIFGTSLYGYGKTNLIDNGDISDYDNNYIIGSNITVYDTSNEIFTFTAVSTDTSSSNSIRSPYNTSITGDQYYFSYDIRRNNSVGANEIRVGFYEAGGTLTYTYTDTDFHTESRIFTPTADIYLRFGGTNTLSISFDNLLAYNLTELFGSGSEPNITTFETYLSDYQELLEDNIYNLTYEEYTYYEILGTSIYDTGKTNLIDNGDISNGSNDYIIGSNITVYDTSNEIFTFTAVSTDTSSSNSIRSQYDTSITGHQYYFSYDIRRNNSVGANEIRVGFYEAGGTLTYTYTDTNFHTESKIYTPTADIYLRFGGTNTLSISFDNLLAYDLTSLFNLVGATIPDLNTFTSYIMRFSDILEYYNDYYTVYYTAGSIDLITPYFQYDTPVEEPFSIWDRIDNALTNAGADSDTSKILISVAIILTVLVVLYVAFKAPLSVITVVATAFYLFFAVIGWYPAWLNLLVMIIIMILAFILIKGGGSKGGNDNV